MRVVSFVDEILEVAGELRKVLRVEPHRDRHVLLGRGELVPDLRCEKFREAAHAVRLGAQPTGSHLHNHHSASEPWSTGATVRGRIGA